MISKYHVVQTYGIQHINDLSTLENSGHQGWRISITRMDEDRVFGSSLFLFDHSGQFGKSATPFFSREDVVITCEDDP